MMSCIETADTPDAAQREPTLAEEVRAAWRNVVVRSVPRRSDFPQSRGDWTADLLAGLTVGVVALPLAMGFGIAAGAGPTPGIVTAIVAGIVAALFGGSRLQVSGPTGAMTVVLLPAIAAHGLGAVPVLAILAGIIVLAAGWLGLGRAVTLIPWPVIEGFTFGIAAIIFMQQVPLVLDVARASGNHNTLASTIDVIGRMRWHDALPGLAVAAGVIVVMVASRRARPSFPSSLLAIVVASVAVRLVGVDVPTIGHLRLGSLVHVPAVPTVAHVTDLLPSAAIVALLAALESLLSARVADGMGDLAPTDPDRELVGQGLANIASGLVGGMPATGAIARTAVNVRAGARSRMAAALHGVVLVVVLLGASRALSVVPLAAIAGVLMMTAARMVDVPTARALVRSGRGGAVVFVATAGTTILFDLARAVEVGIAIAAILVLRTTARASSVLEEELDPHLDHVDDVDVRELLHEHVLVYRLQGSLFFGAAQSFLDELADLDDARVLVLRLGGLQVLDVTGAQALAASIDHFRARGTEVLLCGIRPQHARVLGVLGIPGRRVSRERCFGDLRRALDRARELAAAVD